MLNIDDNTGVTDVVLDPRNPDVLIAASWQRRRHVWTHHQRRAGLGRPPQHRRRQDVEEDHRRPSRRGPRPHRAGDRADRPGHGVRHRRGGRATGGIHRSTDGGVIVGEAEPVRRPGSVLLAPRRGPGEQGPHLRDERPHQVSDDGGRDARPAPRSGKHVDNHEIWIDPKDPKYYLCGCDGGIYESSRPRRQLAVKPNLPVTLLKARYDDSQRRGRDLEHLQAIAKRYKTAAKLLDDVALDPSGATEGSNARRSSGFVTLSTVHSAKGLEWDSLFVIWMTDGWFPSNRFREEFDDLEEERRLLYVATTRAKRELHFVYPLNVYRYGENDAVPALSRFLEPIPPTILPHASLSGEE